VTDNSCHVGHIRCGHQNCLLREGVAAEALTMLVSCSRQCMPLGHHPVHHPVALQRSIRSPSEDKCRCQCNRTEQPRPRHHRPDTSATAQISANRYQVQAPGTTLRRLLSRLRVQPSTWSIQEVLALRLLMTERQRWKCCKRWRPSALPYSRVTSHVLQHSSGIPKL
jgi:hypothetical protein